MRKCFVFGCRIYSRHQRFTGNYIISTRCAQWWYDIAVLRLCHFIRYTCKVKWDPIHNPAQFWLTPCLLNGGHHQRWQLFRWFWMPGLAWREAQFKPKLQKITRVPHVTHFNDFILLCLLLNACLCESKVNIIIFIKATFIFLTQLLLELIK